MLLCCITYVGANNLLGIGGLARLGSTRYRTVYSTRHQLGAGYGCGCGCGCYLFLITGIITVLNVF